VHLVHRATKDHETQAALGQEVQVVPTDVAGRLLQQRRRHARSAVVHLDRQVVEIDLDDDLDRDVGQVGVTVLDRVVQRFDHAELDDREQVPLHPAQATERADALGCASARAQVALDDEGPLRHVNFRRRRRVSWHRRPIDACGIHGPCA
jgi:hypothetical protein